MSSKTHVLITKCSPVSTRWMILLKWKMTLTGLKNRMMLTWSTNHFDTEISWKFANVIFLWNHTIFLQLHKSGWHWVVAHRLRIIVWVADIAINWRHSYFVNVQIKMETTLKEYYLLTTLPGSTAKSNKTRGMQQIHVNLSIVFFSLPVSLTSGFLKFWNLDV